MGNIHRFTDRSQIEQEALDWLIRLDGDEPPTTDELAELSEWLGRSPMHRQELNSLSNLWSNQVLTELNVPLGRHEADSVPEAATGSIGAGVSWIRRPVFAAAAALMLVLGLSITVWWNNNGFAVTNGVYMTAVGQHLTEKLADGSVVHLNTNSQIEVDYTDGFRNIRLLQGEAHFDVVKNLDRPFRVYAGEGRVEAVGTAFTVHLNDQKLDVLVTEGKVEVASLGRELSAKEGGSALSAELVEQDSYADSASISLGLLNAGEAVSVKVASQLALVLAGNEHALSDVVQTVTEDEVKRRQSWQEGFLIFNGEPLADVVAEISRFTTVSIEIAEPELKNIQIGGRFKAGEVEEMFGALEANFGLKVQRVSYNRVLLIAAK